MQRTRVLKFFQFAFILLIWATPLMGQETKIRLKIHAVYGSNDIFGPGAGTNASHDLDMSLFERDLGLKSQKLNGSGIVRNANFPMTPGDAFTTNNRLEITSKLRSGLSLTASFEAYTLNGDPIVGRAFGEELPFDSFTRDSQGRLVPTSGVTLHHTVLQKEVGDFKYSFWWGAFQPELSSRDFNELKLGHVVYRPPLTNESYFEKEDRKLELGRHPLFGGQFVGDFKASGFLKNAHLELFNGKSLPVPVNDGIHRTTNGGRLGLDFDGFNAGVSYFDSFGDRLPSVTGEHQTTWGLDASVPIGKAVALYGLAAGTDYARSGFPSVRGNATVTGVRVKLFENLKLKFQYQDLDKTYELAGGQHKVETYPGNFQGIMSELDWAPKGSRVTFLFYRLAQKETALRAGEPAFAFGDAYFPNLPRSRPGKVRDFRLYGEHLFSGEQWKIRGYFEQVNAFKTDANPANDIDQTNQNFVFYLYRYLRKDLSLDLGYRQVKTFGHFEERRFNSQASIPKIGLTWTPDKEMRFSILYNLYNFQDRNPVSLQLNNFQNNQLITEYFVQF